MIWPFRSAAPQPAAPQPAEVTAPPEAPLWSQLDACGIPFRDPLGDWVSNLHLTASGWCDGLDQCVPNATRPFIPSLDVALHAQVLAQSDMEAPPLYLCGAVQKLGDHRLNYARSISELSRLFGKGAEVSVSNTVAREWRFGLARLRCTVFPPDKGLNIGPNERHERFPNTVEEASITIETGWRPSLSQREADICAQAVNLWALPDASQRPPAAVALTKHSRDWPLARPPLSQGIAVTPQNDVLMVRASGVVDVFLAGQITSLTLDRLTPARGGAQAQLAANTAKTCRDGIVDHPQVIASIDGAIDGLDRCAADLASKLGVPLKTTTQPND
ncbi:hypothetical protein [uncultured Litoreibacter sp.]|uniref:hypothetical protein n=1 Tax=uncultured Litoreibacter sp. TaxID=1392394 RepID=UPI0026225A19|nr:hypothetical protein [uncultured Litoreibacter sp.]